MRYRLRAAILLFAFLLVGVCLFGCDQGSGPGTMTKETARSRIIESAEVLQQAAEDFDKTPLGKVLEATMNSGSGGSTTPFSEGGLTSGLGAVLDTTGGNFNYESSTGVYVWSDSSGTWTQKRPADSLILRFPTTREATGNDATFTLSEYETQSVSIGGITAEVPTQVKSSLKENGEEIFSSRLSVGFSPLVDIPQSLESYAGAFSTSEEAVSNLTYSSTLSADFSDGITYRFKDGLENGSQKIVSTDATIALGDGLGSGGDGNLLGSVDGETRVGQDLRVQYTADLSALVAALGDDSSDSVNSEGINDSVDVRVFDEDNNQVATLRYEGDREQVVVEYPDGQTELLADLLRDLDLR